MDTSKIVARARAILLTPKTEWPVIAAEPDTVGGIYQGYVLIMAALPALVQLVNTSFIRVRIPFMDVYRFGFGTALRNALVTYVFALIGVYVIALIVDTLAPSFKGERNQVQALKTVAYAYTASWVASLLGLIPGLTILGALAGLIYGIYLLRVGLPVTMKCPDESAVGYTVVTILAAIVVGVVFGLIFTALSGTGTPIIQIR